MCCASSDTSAFLLERAIPSAATAPLALVEAVYWLESALHLETQVHTATEAPAGVLKNLGLAHVHLVQCKALSGTADLPLPEQDFFGTLEVIGWPRSTRSHRPTVFYNKIFEPIG